MLSVTAIGSCRIATPLRLGRTSLGYRINTKRIYGFSHSSAEAVQQMYFLHGEFTPLPEIWPMISPRQERATKLAEVHEPSDIYVVEISSAKSLSIGEHKVQLNYLRRHFSDFFDEKERYQTFMRLCQTGAQAELSRFLEKVWSATTAQLDESAILQHVRLELCTEETLLKDLAELRDGLGEVMIVSHVNAQLPDGKTLPARSEFIGGLTRVAKKLNVPFCDPTVQMNQFGQGRSIADNSTSLAHFTDEFSMKLVQDWVDGPLGGIVEKLVMDNPIGNIGRIILPMVQCSSTNEEDTRREELADFLESIVTYWPENVQIRGALLELAITSNDEAATRHSFTQFLLNCDLNQLTDAPTSFFDPLRLSGWCFDLLDHPNLTDAKRRELEAYATRISSCAG